MTKKYGHDFTSMCIGFGADPVCFYCGRTYSHIEEANIWVCDEHTEYMKMIKKIEKEKKK